MGISGFAKFIEETYPGTVSLHHVRQLKLERRVAVDGYNESYTQMHVAKKSIIKQLPPDDIFQCFTSREHINSLNLKIRKVWLNRILDFIITDMKRNVVWVFDGDNVPVLKDEIRAERKERAEKIKAEMDAFVGRYPSDDFPDPQSYRRVLEEYITSKPPSFEDYSVLHTILVSINIPVVKAYGEGEKACARLCDEGITLDPELRCRHVWSADVDSVLFGAPSLIQRYRTFAKGGGGREIGESSMVRIFDMSKVPLPLRTLLMICVAAGCDYLPKGIPGLGLKKAHKLFSSSPEKFPEEHIPIVEMFSHDSSEVDQRYTPPVSLSDDSLVKWFVTVYKP
jgi:5'-3' exonuclease